MIIEFIAENFRSIQNEQIFSMVADDNKGGLEKNLYEPNAQKKLSILKSSVIYGPNASGKSNLLSAIMNLRYLVINSGGNKIDEKIIQYDPYLLDPEYKKLPTNFEIEFLAPDIYDNETKQHYKFVLSYDSDKIIKEELSIYRSAKASVLYKRKNLSPMKWGEYLKGKKQSIESSLLETQLFLSVAGNTKDHPLNIIYRYFRDRIKGINFNIALDKMSSGDFTREKMIGDESKYYTSKIGDFLKAADTGIQNVRIKKIKFKDIKVKSDTKLPQEIIKALEKEMTNRPHAAHFKFKNGKKIGIEEFDIQQESQGTIQLFSLAGPVINTLLEGSTLIIDEISTSLHPSIIKYIIKLFNNKKTNPYNAQLIFSTHDLIVLSSDLFRRDQVWFTQKDKFGSTHIYSLLEFGKNYVRKGINYSSWYLKGKFGAIPFIDNSLFTLIENGKEELNNG